MPVFKKILDSQRGGKILIDQEGYLYNYLRETSRGSTWSCRAKYKLKCPTRIYYTSGSSSSDIEMTVEHNHPPKEGQARAIEVMRKFNKGDHQKLSYKVRKELALLEFDTDDITIEDLPTLLRKRKRSRRRSRIDESVIENVTTSTDLSESDTIVDVETNVPDISSTSLDLVLNKELQDAIEQLVNEPELLQLLINSLVESQEAQGQSQDPEMMEATMIQRERVRNALSPEIQVLPTLQSSNADTSNNTTLISTIPPLEKHEFDIAPGTSSITFINDGCSPNTNKQSSLHIDAVNSASIPILAITADEGNANLVPASTLPPTSLASVTIQGGNVQMLEGIQARFDHENGQNTTAVLVTSSEPHLVTTNHIFSSAGEPSSAGQVVSKLVPLSTLVLAPPAPKKPYCYQCQTLFTDKNQLDIHFNTLRCCDMCKMAFCVKEHYDKHMELNHPDGKKSAWGVLCESCGRVFGVMFQLDAHRIKCANRRSLRCARCFYSYGFEEDLSRHKLTHANLFPFECIDCRKTWPTLTGLQKHQTMKRTEGKASPYKCPMCTKRLCTKGDYQKHVTINHMVDGRKPIKQQEVSNRPGYCSRDPSIRRTQPEILVQMQPDQLCVLPTVATSVTKKEMFCTFCKATFSGQQALLEHEASHLSLCGVCGISNCGANCSSNQQPKTIEKGLDGILLKSDAENSKINYDSRHSNVDETDGDNLVAAEVPLTVIASNGDSLTCS